MPIPKPIKAVFLLSILFWIYLAFSSQVSIGADAKAYEQLSQRIYQEGWISFFKKGPDREPVYLFLVSISIRIADRFGLSYQKIQTFFQILILLITQFLTYQLLRRLKIRDSIIAATLLYLGFSPAIVNSTFSLYSEIGTYPLMLGIILLSPQAWQVIHTSNYKSPIILGITMGMLAGLMALSRAIFEYIFLIFVLPYFYLAFKFLINKNKTSFIGSLLFLTTVLLIFNSFVIPYKCLNKIYNRHYTITDRGPFILYNGAVNRTKRMTSKSFLIALTSVPGENVCRGLMGAKECDDRLLNFVDQAVSKGQELMGSGVPTEEIYPTMTQLALKEIRKNPFQYMLFNSLEGMKMLFWESTKIGFVHYPAWLNKMHSLTIFNYGLRLLMFLLTTASLLYLMNFIFKNRRALFDLKCQDRDIVPTLFLMVWMIILFIGFYTPTNVLTRYAFPIVPFYLATIAFGIEQKLMRHTL